MQFWTWPEYNLEIFKTVNWSKQADRAAFQNRRYWENPDLDSVFHIHFTFEVQPVLRSSLATEDNFPDRKPGSTMETCDGHGKLPVRDSSGKLIAPVCSVWAEVAEELSEIRWAARRAAPAGRLLESRDDVRQRLEAGTQYHPRLFSLGFCMLFTSTGMTGFIDLNIVSKHFGRYLVQQGKCRHTFKCFCFSSSIISRHNQRVPKYQNSTGHCGYWVKVCCSLFIIWSIMNNLDILSCRNRFPNVKRIF